MIATPTSVIPLKITVRPANLLLSFTGAFLCCAVTAALVNFAGWHAVPASSGTALLAVMAGLLFRLPDSFVLAAYCGTFAGGGAVSVEQDHLFWLSALSLIVASVAVAVQCLQSRWPAIGLVGIGGRLGVFAFIGFSIFAVLFRSSVTIGDVGSLKTSALTVSVLGVIVGATTTTEIRRFLVIYTA